MPKLDENKKAYSDIFWSHDGYLSDKWEQYLPIYEMEIGSLIEADKPINLLEIGVQNGGSLEIWSKYLPKGSNIVGIDIDLACTNLIFPDNVHFVLGDACDPTTIDRIPFSEFDVIIDDGSHIPKDVVKTFSLLIDRLKTGGKYIIEDMETSYDINYGGGFRQPSSTTEWAKGFIDALNISSVSNIEANLSPDIESLRKFDRELWRISFYSAIVVFVKNQVVKDKNYRRTMSGRTANVMDPKEWLYNLSEKSFENILMNDHCHKRISSAIHREIQDLRQRQKEIADLLKKLSDIVSVF